MIRVVRAEGLAGPAGGPPPTGLAFAEDGRFVGMTFDPADFKVFPQELPDDEDPPAPIIVEGRP